MNRILAEINNLDLLILNLQPETDFSCGISKFSRLGNRLLGKVTKLKTAPIAVNTKATIFHVRIFLILVN